MTILPKFTRQLLHPRYFLLWCGIGALYLVVQLPYKFLNKLGPIVGRLAMKVLTDRVYVTARNLHLCFPEKTEVERAKLLKENFESVGMALFETGMAWFWSDDRVKKHFTVTGLEHITKAQQEGKGVLLLGVHFLTLELGARIFGIYNPGIGVYRPNNNPVLDWLQTYGRMRSNKDMINRRDVKGMIHALKQGDILWYAPDHDYGPKSSVFAPFFAVENAASTKGSYMLIRMSQPAIIPFLARRLPGNSGYEMVILPAAEDIPVDSDVHTAIALNKLVERCVMMAPEQYMWLHRRFKTRPQGEHSLY